MLCTMMGYDGPVTLPASPQVTPVTTTRSQSTPTGQATVAKAVIINKTKALWKKKKKTIALWRAYSELFSNFITILAKAPEPASGQSPFNPHLSTVLWLSPSSPRHPMLAQ